MQCKTPVRTFMLAGSFWKSRGRLLAHLMRLSTEGFDEVPTL